MYSLEFPGLAEAVASIEHRLNIMGYAPLQAISRHSELKRPILTARRSFCRLRRRVLTAAGALVHDDLEAWLRHELDRYGRDPVTTWHRLLRLGHTLTESRVTVSFIVADRYGVRADDFLQFEVELEEERVDQRLFASDLEHMGKAPRKPPEDLQALVRRAVAGAKMKPAQCRQYLPPTYRLRRAVDVALFVDEAKRVDLERHVAEGRRRVTLGGRGGVPTRVALAKAFPEEYHSYRWNGRRLFDDWTTSSAGHSGNRLSEHWALELTDFRSTTGERVMSMNPLPGKFFALKAPQPNASDHRLITRLDFLDRQAKVPFAWFFFMLRGDGDVNDWTGHRIESPSPNRRRSSVSQGYGRRVIEAVEAGTVVLPERDYQVLKRWDQEPYAFPQVLSPWHKEGPVVGGPLAERRRPTEFLVPPMRLAGLGESADG